MKTLSDTDNGLPPRRQLSGAHHVSIELENKCGNEERMDHVAGRRMEVKDGIDKDIKNDLDNIIRTSIKESILLQKDGKFGAVSMELNDVFKIPIIIEIRDKILTNMINEWNAFSSDKIRNWLTGSVKLGNIQVKGLNLTVLLTGTTGDADIVKFRTDLLNNANKDS